MLRLRIHILVFTVITLLAVSIDFDESQAQAQPLFRQLAGSWGGSGVMELSDGTKERVSCRGYYIARSAASALALAIRCQSSNQSIEIRSKIVERGGGISGDWEERTYQLRGNMSGRAAANRLDLSFSGSISGSMTIALTRGTHRVTIETNGAGFSGVSITMRKG